MTTLDRRLSEMGWKLLNIEVINGAHAGSIYRIDVIDQENNKAKYIYKEFAGDRNNEVDVYGKLKSYIKPFSKLVKVWNSSPKAILMLDLKMPLKETFKELPIRHKKTLIEGILQKLSYLHSLNPRKAANELPTHFITSEWREWGLDQIKKLCLRHQWAKSKWIKTIDYPYEQLGLTNYMFRSPLTLTHGDPHLENIFYFEEHIWFIDWEWAAIGSPLRDITIMLQDIYELELIQFAFNSYRGILEVKNLNISKDDYRSDFNHLYIDHTTMMLAWEIEKYFQGYTSEERVKEITEFKIGEIDRC
ncbi:phosphotransferase family protein [Halobacillus amylolyticus]|uniref:Phosphotransferase n=1 Tax=Halobacillus amylolyticus TaxID=2932259 RepID=A0ABY4HD88_9BACI|nr:phosphotransferase [Halobacillus amylolyticus]UOR12817.1 phosphotransferase [Halobacillus amylolyticus]